jgi:hypothetical protein
MPLRRYIVPLKVELEVFAGDPFFIERWLGFEMEETNVLEFSEETGFDLIPAEGMTEEELASVVVREVQRVEED